VLPSLNRRRKRITLEVSRKKLKLVSFITNYFLFLEYKLKEKRMAEAEALAREKGDKEYAMNVRIH